MDYTKDQKTILSVKNLVVKFRVRGRILTAIRGIDLDMYQDECIAIVGESGSGKSVFTKTFAGMLDANGFIEQGDIIFDDPTLADTDVALSPAIRRILAQTEEKLNEYAKLEKGSEIYLLMEDLKHKEAERCSLSDAEQQSMEDELRELVFERTELFNLKQTLDSGKEKVKIKETAAKIDQLDARIKQMQATKVAKIKARKAQAKADIAAVQAYREKLSALKARYEESTSHDISPETRERNKVLAKEVAPSIGR